MALPAALPPSLQAWIRALLGDREPDFVPLAGGFGDGIRGGVGALGRRVFLKAVPSHTPSAEDARTEAIVVPALPRQAGAPILLGVREEDGWHVAVSEFVDGVHPHEPWQREQLAIASAHVLRMHEALATVPAPAIPTVADRMRGRATTWSRLASGERPPTLHDHGTAWERANIDRLASWETAFPALVAEAHLVHFDLRHDNILFTSRGDVRVLDWGRASLGPAWVDPVCMLLESEVSASTLQPLFAETERRCAADPEAVNALLAVLSSYWHGAIAEDTGASEELTGRRRRSLAAAQHWLRERAN